MFDENGSKPIDFKFGRDRLPSKEFEPFSFKSSLRILTKPFNVGSPSANEWEVICNTGITTKVLGVGSDIGRITQQEKKWSVYHDERGQYKPIDSESLSERKPDVCEMTVDGGIAIFMMAVPVTGSDFEVQRGKLVRQPDRTYRHVETSIINKVDLKGLGEGKPIYSNLLPEAPAFALLKDGRRGQTKQFGESSRELNWGNMTETVTVEPKESLFEDELWLDDQHSRLLKEAVDFLKDDPTSKVVNLVDRHPNGKIFSLEEKVKIIELLTYVLGQLFSWTTSSVERYEDRMGFSSKSREGVKFITFDNLSSDHAPVEELRAEVGTEALSVENHKKVVEVETADEEKLRDIDRVITNRQVGSKFSGEVIIHGVSLTAPDYNLDKRGEYRMHPYGDIANRYIAATDPSSRSSAVNWIIRASKDPMQNSDHYLKEKDFSSKLALSYIVDEDDPSITHMFLSAPEKNSDFRNRQTFFCDMACDIPTDNVHGLIEIINKNPSNAEKFVQIVFDGIDDATERISVDGVALIDVEKYIPNSRNEETRARLRDETSQVLQFLRDNDRLDISAITILNYDEDDGFPQHLDG